MHACALGRFSRVWLFATPWTVARQAPLSMAFSRQEYLSGLPHPPPGHPPRPGVKPATLMSPTFASGFFTTSAISKPCIWKMIWFKLHQTTSLKFGKDWNTLLAKEVKEIVKKHTRVHSRCWWMHRQSTLEDSLALFYKSKQSYLRIQEVYLLYLGNCFAKLWNKN